MNDAGSSTIDSPMLYHDQSVPPCSVEKPSVNEKPYSTLVNNRKMVHKRKLSSGQSHDIASKLLQLKQIVYQENLIHEQMNRINLETQRIQKLLDMLYTTDSKDDTDHSE